MTRSNSYAPGTALTQTQKVIMDLLLEGMANKNIAYHMNVSELTIKVHIADMLRRYQVQNRLQLVLKHLRKEGRLINAK